jgi:long-chain acyl-CoA synthetase
MHPIAHAASRPDHPAVIMTGSGAQMTYREMDEASNRFGHLLRSRGMGPADEGGDAFAVLLENRMEFYILNWGSQRVGTMLVPVSTRLTGPEIAYILKDSEAKLLVTSRRFAEVLDVIRDECPDLEILVMDSGGKDDFAAELARHSDAAIENPHVGQVMLYSSGTTGRPKGVKPAAPEDTDPQAVVPLMGLATMGVGWPADGSMVYLSPAPLYHAAPWGWSSVVHRLGGTVW